MKQGIKPVDVKTDISGNTGVYWNEKISGELETIFRVLCMKYSDERLKRETRLKMVFVL
jgi:hypothetical protein